MMTKITGTFIASHGGSVFEPDNPNAEEREIPQHFVNHGLVDGDKICLTLSSSIPASIKAIDLITRSREIIGILQDDGFVTPLHEIGQNEVKVVKHASSDPQLNAKVDDIVLLCLETPGSALEANDSQICGEIIEVLGDRENAGIEVEIALCNFNIPSSWDKEVLLEAESAAKQAITEYAYQDLRDINFVTIDGEDAKDFDDAIYCEKEKGGWCISVAIADVASYVKSESRLDKSAQERGNSVYFPGRVVPMLPSNLSDEVCSLRPKEDRLTLVCRFRLSTDGTVKSYEFLHALIQSKARLSYSKVARFFAKKSINNFPAAIANMLLEARKAFQQLLQCRQQRGALDLDMPETRIICDKEGNVQAIVPVIRNDAHRLIEEFMICANVCAAKFLEQNYRSLPYRVHSGIKKDALEDLKIFLRFRKLNLPGNSTQNLSVLLNQLEQHKDKHLIQSMILRALSKAEYHTNNIGHFGLSLHQYTHFTSPIRRYSDLVVHRLIHHVLRSVNGVAYTKDELQNIATHCSMTERRANNAVYDIEKYLKCTYASKHISKTMMGTVIAVTNFGLFINLEDINVEGLLHVTQLIGDYYYFDEPRQRLIGKRRGQTYGLGEVLKVVLINAYPDERKIDLGLAV